MAITSYEVPIDWIPDDNYINPKFDFPEYLAWRLSQDLKRGVAIWSIRQVVESPTYTIDQLLPIVYTVIEVSEDLQKYGYARQLAPKQSISTVEAFIDETSARDY